MKGSLHNHSDWSDWRQSLAQLVKDCLELGFSYWAVTDHSKSSFQANGLQASRLERQIEDIEQINRELSL